MNIPTYDEGQFVAQTDDGAHRQKKRLASDMTGEEEIAFQPAKRPCVYARQRRKKVVFAISPFALGQCYEEIRHAVANVGLRNMKQSFLGTRPR